MSMPTFGNQRRKVEILKGEHAGKSATSVDQIGWYYHLRLDETGEPVQLHRSYVKVVGWVKTDSR